MNDDQLEKLIGRAKQYGSWEEDLLEFGKQVVAEMERRQEVAKRRIACLENGGHHFQFSGNMPMGDWEMADGTTTISGWMGCDIKCLNCDAWLGIKYEEEM